MTDLSNADDRVTLSRNETESLCLKAARGAGFSWGMAEEVGFATGWLAAQGIDGATALLQMLTRKPGRPFGLGAPIPTLGYWQSPDDDPMCPIQLGAALIDHALLSNGPFSRETKLDPVETPLLLLPFLARAAQISHKALFVDWQQNNLCITSDGAFDRRAIDAWITTRVLAMKVAPSTKPCAGTLPAEQGQLPSILLSTVNELGTLALRTTVPATLASRTGAGSSTPDND